MANRLIVLPDEKTVGTLGVLRVGRAPMIKDVMVWLDGGIADEIRLEVAGSIARRFESQVIALVLNPIP
jgi:hypothetical protein